MHPAKGLKAWDAADLLADEVRAALRSAPRHSDIADQLMRAADSISAHISEGSGRETVPDRKHFFIMGRSSARETINHIKRARGARLIDQRQFYRLTNRATVTHSLVAALVRNLERRRNN
jgi:four helix bundle protein